MGRELKRVSMDFYWPQKKIWKGYINPYSQFMKKCPSCDGSGYTPGSKKIKDQWWGDSEFDPVKYGAVPVMKDNPVIHEWAVRNVARSSGTQDSIPSEASLDQYYIRYEQNRIWRECVSNHWCYHLIQADVDALIENDKLWEFTRRPRTQAQHDELKAEQDAGGSGYWLKSSNGYIPSVDEVNRWSLENHANFSNNFEWTCINARCIREGVTFLCEMCNGHGEIWRDIHKQNIVDLMVDINGDPNVLTPEQIADLPEQLPPETLQKLHDDWESYDPPEGEGFQLWETTSEGSPSSPVFDSLDSLCSWAEINATTFGSFKTTAENWKSMLSDDHVFHQEGNMVFM